MSLGGTGMQALRFSGPFVFLASVPLLFQISDAAPLAVPISILLVLLLAHSLRTQNSVVETGSPAFRLLPILYIPLQLAVIVWAAHAVTRPGATALAFVSLVVAVGVCTGVFGVLAAHEMVHSRLRWHQWLGTLLLTGMSYRHFRVAHVYGHHRFAATERDASTARLGESFYRFLLRTIPAQMLEAWRFEERRYRGQSPALLRNRVAQDVTLMIAVYAGLNALWGSRAVGFLAAESTVAIIVLEAFNYVAHYGLLRRVHDGAMESFADHHSWNSSGAGNFLISNMGRHSHHHRAPSISYEALRPVTEPLELPGGYAGAILLALVPPLWRATMDPRVHAARGERESGYVGGSRSAAALP